MAKIIIPGGSGYLGQALAKVLDDRGDEVVILGRRGGSVGAGRLVGWDGMTVGAWANELDGADAIVHLTGRRVDTRATKKNIDELISSRVQPVRVVGEAIARCSAPPKVWVQSSSLAIFGEGGDNIIDEHTIPSGIGPREMVTVCLAWEGAFHRAIDELDATGHSVSRSVLLRIGIGLGGTGDPATKKLMQLVKLGLGGKVGSGRQWVSWASLDDVLRVMVMAIDDPTMSGLVHVTSPNPVTNDTMMSTYRRLLNRKVGLASPSIVARLGAPLLGSSGSLALTGRRCVPTRLLAQGFVFHDPDFEPTARRALENCGATI